MLSDGTWSYTWEHGRELASMSGGGTTWNFTYNADGLRTKRTNGSTTYSYVYNGSSLSQMTVGSNTLYFAYDASGTPLSVTYNGTRYHYVTNLQGDVVQIRQGTTPVVNYTYDAWGKLLTTTGSMASTLGTHNPLRYRGYVYDTETQLYYLQSRYYNPAMGRFINADVDASTGHGLLGTNMFAYCANNPVNYTDATGQDWWHWAAAAAIVVVAAIAVVATAGGLAGAALAVTAVANGVAVSSTATTVAAGVFVGSSVALASSAYSAAIESDSVEEFKQYGEEALIATAVGGGYGAATAYSLPGHNCFVAGTLVLTQNGSTPIQNISVGDLVWSWDEKTGTVLLSEVTDIYISQTQELVHVFVNGEEIITTPEHPFYSPTNGWIEAINLHGGDALILFNGNIVVVDEISSEILDSPVSVFNFQVNESHTYYVATLGVLVHNKCSGSYEIEFESGKNYVGKGSEARMNVSAKVHSTIHNDPVVSMKWEYAPDTQTAFVDEYFKMAVRGVNNDNTYNIIWSPGRKIFINSLR